MFFHVNACLSLRIHLLLWWSLDTPIDAGGNSCSLHCLLKNNPGPLVTVLLPTTVLLRLQQCLSLHCSLPFEVSCSVVKRTLLWQSLCFLKIQTLLCYQAVGSADEPCAICPTFVADFFYQNRHRAP